MLNSMTGFASLSGDLGTLRWDWEIRSVNGKGLDFRVRLPDGYDALEPILRAEAKAHLTRGNVTVSLKNAERASAGHAKIQQDGLAAALSALTEIENMAQSNGLNLAPMNAAQVAQLPGVLALDTEGSGEVPGQYYSRSPPSPGG